MTTKTKSSEIKIFRVYDAPVKAVWEAWADPKEAAEWWGPRGFTLTSHEKDLRPGGTWRYTMHGPVGNDFPNTTRYFEVEKYSRMVYDHGGNENTPPLFRVTVQFTEIDGKTHMDMTMKLPTPERAEETRKFIKKAGGDATWDRLAEYLVKKSSGKELFVINRSFDAPVNKMYDMWTDPAHFSQWLAPTGFNMSFINADIKPGGSSFYMMAGGNMKMYGKAQYIEMERPHRIVYAQQFCDEKGNISRHPMAPTWPETMRTEVMFTEDGPDQTRVTVIWEVVGKASPEEMETFIKGRAGMTQGWTGSFDKLEAYLEALPIPAPRQGMS